MVEGLPEVETRVITEDSLAAMLDGVPLREAIGATFFLQVGAWQNGGVYKRGWLDQPNFGEALNVYPRTNIEKMAARLTTTPTAFRAAFQEHSVGTLTAGRFDYNPLVATPFIDLGRGSLLRRRPGSSCVQSPPVACTTPATPSTVRPSPMTSAACSSTTSGDSSSSSKARRSSPRSSSAEAEAPRASIGS